MSQRILRRPFQWQVQEQVTLRANQEEFNIKLQTMLKRTLPFTIALKLKRADSLETVGGYLPARPLGHPRRISLTSAFSSGDNETQVSSSFESPTSSRFFTRIPSAHRVVLHKSSLPAAYTTNASNDECKDVLRDCCTASKSK